MALPIKIIATGKALPQRQVTSAELDIFLNKKAGFVENKSGIIHRYYVDESDSTVSLAAAALKDAMKNANLGPSAIDLLICSSAVPQQILPCTASFILEQAGFPESTPGFDVNASCIGFVAALHLAANLVTTGAYKRIAIVSAECASRGLNFDDPESSLIFGDGAAAAIVERGQGVSACESYLMETYPKGKHFCEIRGGGTLRNPSVGMNDSDFKFHMQGKRVFRLTAEKIEGFLDKLFAPLSYTRDEMDVVIPHQASHLGMLHVTERLKLKKESVINIYNTHGNQVSASIPTALHEAMITGRIQEGSKILLLGTAAGLTIGGMVLTA